MKGKGEKKRRKGETQETTSRAPVLAGARGYPQANFWNFNSDWSSLLWGQWRMLVWVPWLVASRPGIILLWRIVSVFRKNPLLGYSTCGCPRAPAVEIFHLLTEPFLWYNWFFWRILSWMMKLYPGLSILCQQLQETLMHFFLQLEALPAGTRGHPQATPSLYQDVQAPFFFLIFNAAPPHLGRIHDPSSPWSADAIWEGFFQEKLDVGFGSSKWGMFQASTSSLGNFVSLSLWTGKCLFFW